MTNTETPTITPDPDRNGVILHLPEITYLDTQTWAVDVGLTPEGLAALRTALGVPTDRAAVLREAADVLGRMDYDTDSNDYGYDTYRDAWNGGVMDAADRLRRMADETATETPAARAVHLCNAATMHRLGNQATAHGPHPWEPQPGMEPVHCPGTRKPAAGARQSDDDPGRIVAYRSLGGRILRCLNHIPPEPEDDFVPITADDLPDGGLCTHPECGVDVLIPQPAAEPRQDGARISPPPA